MIIDNVIWWLLSGIIVVLLIMVGWFGKKQINNILNELKKINTMLTNILMSQARSDEKFDNIDKMLFNHEKAIGILSHDYNKLNEELQKFKVEMRK